jgi:hypothetical protein
MNNNNPLTLREFLRQSIGWAFLEMAAKLDIEPSRKKRLMRKSILTIPKSMTAEELWEIEDKIQNNIDKDFSFRQKLNEAIEMSFISEVSN